jgi:type IV secretion system protein VirD4
MKKGNIIAVIILITVLGLGLIAGGQFAGGYFLLKRLGLDPHAVSLLTLFDYYSAYGGMPGPVGRFLKMSMAIAALPVVALLVMLGVLIAARKSLIDKLHGEARFATDAEIKRAGMFYDPKKKTKWPAVILGKKGNRFVADYSQEYTTLSAPPGAGKGVSFVIPNLLMYTHSVLNFDPKTENYRITAGYRRTVMGQDVYLFSPDNEEFQSHCWNPMDYISDDPRVMLADIKALTSILIDAPPGPNQGFYLTARDALDGILLYMMESPEEERTMYNADKINTVAMGFDQWAPIIIARRSNSGRPLREQTVRLMMGYANSNDKMKETVRGIISTALSVFTDAKARAATRKSDFDFRDFRKKPMTVYVGIQPNNVERFTKMLNIFFSQALSVNTGMLPEDGPKDENGESVLKYQFLPLLDEFVALGRIGVIQKSSGYTRAYNVRYGIVYQNKQQVYADDVYGQAGGQALLETMHNEIVYATESLADAKEYSERLGYITLKHRERSYSHSKQGTGTNDQTQRFQRALMLPQEIMRLPYEEQLIFKKGGRIHPIHCQKIVYYKDEYFKGRFGLPYPDVPMMEFEAA